MPGFSETERFSGAGGKSAGAVVSIGLALGMSIAMGTAVAGDAHTGLSAAGLEAYVKAFQLAAATTPKPPKEDDDLLTKEDDDDLLTKEDDDDLLKKDDDDLLTDEKDEDSLLTDEKDEDSLLTDEKDTADTPKEDEETDAAKGASVAHEALFAESRFPSAATCGTCHPKHYREWSAGAGGGCGDVPISVEIRGAGVVG